MGSGRFGGAARVLCTERRTKLTGRAQGAEREGEGAKGYGELGKLGRGERRERGQWAEPGLLPPKFSSSFFFEFSIF